MLSEKIKKTIISITISSLLFINISYVQAKPIPQKYNITNAATYQITKKYELQNKSDHVISNISLNINLGNDNDESPYVICPSSFVVNGAEIVTEDGNKKAKMIIPELFPGETKEIIITRNIITGSINYNINNSIISSDYNDFENYSRYIIPEDKIESDDSEIKAKAAEITQGLDNPYEKAKAIFDFVVNHMTYKTGNNANKGALNALETGEGVCEDYTSLFIALCRAEGIPARKVIGSRLNKELNENEVSTGEYHMWAEFYIPEYGWVIAEPTMNKTSDKSKRFAQNYYNFEHMFDGYSESFSAKYKAENPFDTNFLYLTSNEGSTIERMSDYADILAEPYSSYQSRLDDTIKLVEKAEETGTEEILENAKKMVNVLMESKEKTDLLNRLNAIPSQEELKAYQEQLTAATNEVAKAEGSKLQADVDSARPLVNVLNDSDKASLGARLDAVQKAIDVENVNKDYQTQLATATNAVAKAEGSKLQADVDSARDLVNALRPADKAALSDRLDVVQKVINADKNYKAHLTAATNAVVKAEYSKTQADVDSARTLVNVLNDSDKASLGARLDAVQKAIDAEKAYKAQLTTATNAVTKAEGSNVQADVNSARTLVNALNDSDKASFGARLDAVQKIINDTENAEKAYQTKLTAATNAVVKAEGSKLQADVDSARTLVNALPDCADKTALSARLDAVQKSIDADKAYQTQLTAATNAVVKAESSKLQADGDSARALVNVLRPADKASLGDRLDSVQKAINDSNTENVYNAQLITAIQAVERAESSKLQNDVYSARTLVNSLIPVDKTILGARLDTVQRIINDSNNNKSKEDTAINLVRTAEYNLTRESYNSAVNAVNNLENGTTKTSLEYRLNNVLRAIQSRENSQRNEYQNPIYRTEEENAINLVTICENNTTREGYNSALNAVANLYNNLTVDNYEKTVKLVYNLRPEIPERKDLLDRLDSMMMGLVVKNNTSDSREVKEVLSSINNAERNLNSIAYNQAYSQVGKLDDSKFRELKPLLTDRLSVVNNKINDRKLKSKFPQLIQYPFLETKDTGKTWRISFNKQLDKETVNTNNIYITDSRGNNIKCIVYSNGNTLSVTPVGGYIQNEQYAIYINSNVKSIDNKSISNGYYVTFEVAK